MGIALNDINGLLRMHYKPIIGIVIKSKYIEDVKNDILKCKGQYVFKDIEKPTLFVTIISVMLPFGKKDDIENYLVTFHISDTGITKTVPITAIWHWYRSGYPRDGKDPRYYTDFPWKLLKPLKLYSEGTINLDTLKNTVLKDKVSRYGFFDDYYKHTLPRILDEKTGSSDLNLFIKQKYKQYYDSHLEDIKEGHRHPSESSWMYIGVLHRDIHEDYFLPDIAKDNPFIKLELTAIHDMLNRWHNQKDKQS